MSGASQDLNARRREPASRELRAPAVNINNSYQGHVRVLPEEAAVDTAGDMVWMDLGRLFTVRAAVEGVSSSRQVLYQVLMYPSRRGIKSG